MRIEITKSATSFLLPLPDLLACAACMGDGGHRPNLAGVFCEFDLSGKVWIAATNGAVLMSAECVIGSSIGSEAPTQTDDEGRRGFILSFNPLDKAFKVAAKHAPVWAFGDTKTGIVQTVSDSASDGTAERHGVAACQRIDGIFPPWRRVFPSPGYDLPDSKGTPLLMSSMMKIRAAGRAYTPNPVVNLQPGPEGRPCTVTFPGRENVTGLIMPVVRR